MSNIDIDKLRHWIGRKEERNDTASIPALSGFAAMLDRHGDDPVAGSMVPPGAHWLYFLDAAPQAQLSPDGHAARGGFMPPVDLPRRMWAGAVLEFFQTIKTGEAIRRTSEIIDVSLKTGSQGDLVFVTVRHDISGDLGLAIRDEQTIVYRQDEKSSADHSSTTPGGPDALDPDTVPWMRRVTPGEVMLFRYSALTFNGHRIHYDHPYATGVEGYPGLVVHGPLTATLLMDLCRVFQPDRDIARFECRGRRPLFCGETITLAGLPQAGGTCADLWALNGGGRVAMTGNVIFK